MAESQWQVRVISGFPAEVRKWRGGTVTGEGKVIGIPFNYKQVLRFDPKTYGCDFFCGSGFDDNSTWCGSVALPNDEFLGLPMAADRALIVRPKVGSTEFVGKWDAQDMGWYGGVLVPGGKVLCIPCSSPQFLLIDPKTGTSELFGKVPGPYKWAGCVALPDGRVVGIPLNSRQVVIVDSEARTVELFGDLASDFKWSGGVATGDGMVVGIPSDSPHVLLIDPQAKTTELFGNLPGKFKWAGGVLAHNGLVVAIPSDSPSVLLIDHASRSTELLGDLPGRLKWAGGVALPDGRIFGIPYCSNCMLELTPRNRLVLTLHASIQDNGSLELLCLSLGGQEVAALSLDPLTLFRHVRAELAEQKGLPIPSIGLLLPGGDLIDSGQDELPLAVVFATGPADESRVAA